MVGDGCKTSKKGILSSRFTNYHSKGKIVQQIRCSRPFGGSQLPQSGGFCMLAGSSTNANNGKSIKKRNELLK